MKKETQVLLVVGIIILAFLVLKYAGLLSILGSNDHHYTAFGQNWTVSAAWANQAVSGSDSSCKYSITDTSSATALSLTSHGGGTSTCDFHLGGTIRLDNLDLTQYSTVVIHRSGTLTAGTKANSYGVSTSITGVTGAQGASASIPRGTTGSIALGDITITRSNGQEIVYANPESPSGYVLPAGQPFTFSTSTSATSDGYADASMSITGLDLTPLPVVASPVPPPPAVLPPGPVVNAPPPNVYTPPAVPVVNSPSPVPAPGPSNDTWWVVIPVIFLIGFGFIYLFTRRKP